MEGGISVGQTDKQFNGFLRVIIRALKDAMNESDSDKKQKMLEALLSDLQTTLED